MASPLYEKLLPPPDHELDSDSDFPEEFETGEALHDDPFRPSQEPTDHDRAILQEEIDREILLTKLKPGTRIEKIFNKVLHENPEEKGKKKMERAETRRRERRLQRKRRKGEEKELMYEMEEGANRNSSSESLSSLADRMPKRRVTTASRLRKWACLILLPVIIFGLFYALVYGAYKLSGLPKEIIPIILVSNGTAMFAPTTILISLDGFRADFLDRGLTPTLNQFIKEGVSPKYMMPSFPSVTFPNHYTLVTGLYPESHGVVGNTFWDPEMQEEFDYHTREHSMQPKWWSGGEPIWTTAEKAGIRTAIHMWPGSEAHIQIEPMFVDKYNGTETLSRKVDRIFEFLDQPSKYDIHTTATTSRPQLIAAYVPDVDADGHLHGPNSTEIRQTISSVDTMLHDIFIGLEARNLTSLVNIIVVSDHGMATTSTDRLIQLESLIDISLIEHTDGWPLYGLRPKDPTELESMYASLSTAASRSGGSFEVYLRDQDMPSQYHFSNNDRIAPLWLVPKTGWAIVQKGDFDVELGRKNGEVYHPRGLHGYDHEHPLMRAIFIARGPAFPHEPGSKVENFQNTEVYNILCDTLHIPPLANNGTLRLPFRPIGLHSDPTLPQEDDLPAIDLPASSSPSPIEPTPPTPTETREVKGGSEDGAPKIGVDIPDIDTPRPVISHDNGAPMETGAPEAGEEDGEEGEEEEIEKGIRAWWKYLLSKIEEAKHSIFGDGNGGNKGA